MIFGVFREKEKIVFLCLAANFMYLCAIYNCSDLCCIDNKEDVDWQHLISNKRLGQELRHSERHDDRSEFKRDYDRLIFSAPFRRMQNKTQVFPLPGSIFVHNRLTHSLEVASVGRSLGDDVAHLIMQRRPELRDTNFEQIGTIVSPPSICKRL